MQNMGIIKMHNVNGFKCYVVHTREWDIIPGFDGV